MLKWAVEASRAENVGFGSTIVCNFTYAFNFSTNKIKDSIREKLTQLEFRHKNVFLRVYKRGFLFPPLFATSIVSILAPE